MKVTISDVAKLAGVSTATVSHTINSTRYVSGETKEKVYKAIAELGYTPDASARSFRTGKKKTIGFIVPDISNKFFATMIESVENYLSSHGYHLIIANTKENPEREETNIRLLAAGLVDGLLIASTIEDFSRFESLIPAGFPVVLVDRTFDVKRFPSVCVSNFQPIYRSVCRLAGKGDKRIGIIGGLVAGYKPNEIAAMFTKYGKEMFTAALVLGMAKAVSLVLTQGNIIDTMVYGMSSILGGLPAGLSAVIMFLIQTIVNFFINSGSGQAAAMMPIMAPLSDLIGVSRQTAILAFQMGDGLSNMIWPTSASMMAYVFAANEKFESYLKFVLPIFLIVSVLGAIMLVIGTAIGY